MTDNAKHIRVLQSMTHLFSLGDGNSYPCSCRECQALKAAVAALGPIDMLLFCPRCNTQHIDAPEPENEFKPPHILDGSADDPVRPLREPWTNPPHRSHLCHACGHVWRPADVPTNGIAKLKTHGSCDSPKPFDPLILLPAEPTGRMLLAGHMGGGQNVSCGEIFKAMAAEWLRENANG